MTQVLQITPRPPDGPDALRYGRRTAVDAGFVSGRRPHVDGGRGGPAVGQYAGPDRVRRSALG
ncbi:hypothetical protein Pen02_00980 [Plantactinospora endophytica]|uniref:Uncharacterized protein n=1 Tax=Plantactinospora endophytica TaxID=673535 RepID=A0ABQ4DRU4_9ACTN|nr:hypothetical protein Pen02_00980 [Plantactinospora endophytica]